MSCVKVNFKEPLSVSHKEMESSCQLEQQLVQPNIISISTATMESEVSFEQG